VQTHDGKPARFGLAPGNLGLADVHSAASAQAYRREGAGVDSQPPLTDTFLHGEL